MPVRLVNFVETGAGTDAAPMAGVMIDGGIADLQRLQSACTIVKAECDCPECWTSALDVLTCDACLQAAGQYAAWLEEQDASAVEGIVMGLDDVKLLSPVLAPGKVFCLAQNFPSHIGETRTIMNAGAKTLSSGATPKVFLKPTPNTICGPGDPILISPNAQFIDYEAEVAVIIGQRCKYVEPEDAWEYIAGVACMNDVSERNLKLWPRTEVGEWDKFFDWLNGKWMDNFAPMGPCAVSSKHVDINDLDLKCYVNGELRQQGNTGEMIHSAAQTVSYISQMLTLEKGDIIAMGTPGGVGKAQGKMLKHGDEVTVEVDGIGKLTNPVVAEPA